MPIYVFRDDTGEPHELFFRSSEVPSIGDSIEHEGQTLVRVPHFHLGSGMDTNRAHAKYPYASHSLPIWTRPEGEKTGQKTRFTKDGKPIIRSKAHETDFAARMNMTKH